MKRLRSFAPFALAGALLLVCAALAVADAVPGATGLPSGPIVPAIDANDELVDIRVTTRAVSVSERLRVYVEGPAGAPASMFEPEPNRRLFSRLPVSGIDGLGGVLRDEPFSGRAVWLVLMVRNLTDDDSFCLVGDGAGFAPSAMALVSQDGGVAWYAGARLEAQRHRSSIGDATAYRFALPPGQRCALYVRLDGRKSLGPGLSVWPSKLLAERDGMAAWLVGLLVGIAAAACLVLWVLPAPRPEGAMERVRPLRRVFAALALPSLVLGARGGGLGAILAGDGLPRFLTALVLGVAAMAFDAAASTRAASTQSGSGHLNIAALLYRSAVGLVVATASCLAVSPATSFILPAYLLLRLCLMAGDAMFRSVRAAAESASDLALLRERLRQESDEGRGFMTATARALSGPLHGIVGMLEDIDALVSELPLVSRNAVADIGLARAEAARIDTIVSNMLSYADGGAAGLSIEDFDLASIVGAAANLLRLASAGQVLHIDVSVPIIEMKSDVRLVRQLLYNALHWAVRNGSSRISVQATSTDEWSRIQIDDVGPASTSVDAPADDSLAMDGTVMSRLAGLVGGEVVYPAGDDGSTLVVNLPRWIQAPISLPALPEPLLAETGPGQPAGQHRVAGRILVAGNEPVMVLAVKRRLEASGWAAVATVSARDALARVTGEESFDLVIVDSVMPEMSGFEFCASIRASHGPESVPVIILIESGRPDEIERSFKAGANDYIARPASGLELAARVKTHVDLASSIRRELSQAARMAELDKYRTLAMLSAGVAHEINTPNNAVLRNVPMLKEIWSVLDVVIDRINREEGGFSVRGFGYDDLKRDVPDMLNDLYMGAQDIRRIVEGLKDYARSPSGSEALSPVDINEVVQYAVRLLKHSIVVATDHCTLSLQDGLPHIQADRLKLTQVVVNVLENALQALPDRSHGVTIATLAESAEGQGESIVVRIVDDGIGMSAETLASVFDPFFTTKRDKGGSGLGMAVVSGIVHDVGGSIALRSEPGAGTTVTIRIPVRRNVKGDADGQ